MFVFLKKLFYYILKLFIEISIPKKGNSKECSNYHTIALISHARKVMLKILEARLQSMWNENFQIGVQAGFSKGRGTRDQIANICWIMKKARESQKNICFCLIDYSKAFDCGDHNKLWKILKEMGIPGHLNCLLRNQHGGQEAVVRTRHGKKKKNRHGTTNWFQIGKGIHQGCILSPCLLTFMQNRSCEMPGWMKLKLESRLSGEISITSGMQMPPPLWQKIKRN